MGSWVCRGSLFAVGVVVLLVAGCANDSAKDPVATEPVRTIEVTAENISFRPTILSALPGEIIRFRVINRDQIDHQFRVFQVSDSGAALGEGWRLGTIPAGETRTGLLDITLCAPCDFKFICDLHPDRMNGILRGVKLSGNVSQEPVQRGKPSSSP